MFYKIKSLKACDDLTLHAIFTNGIEKVYDIRTMFSVYEPMKALENVELFKQAKLSPGGYAVEWNDELDLDANDIWEDGIETDTKYYLSPKEELAATIAEIRGEKGLSQRELSKLTGIQQADICKIENANSNPSFTTLVRLAEGMGKKLKIEFV